MSSGAVAHVRTKKPTAKPPLFLSPLEDVTIPEGEILTLKCQVAGEPMPEVFSGVEFDIKMENIFKIYSIGQMVPGWRTDSGR